jgi:hypothetical protein
MKMPSNPASIKYSHQWHLREADAPKSGGCIVAARRGACASFGFETSIIDISLGGQTLQAHNPGGVILPPSRSDTCGGCVS